MCIRDSSTSLGYKIDVYQESINKTFSEYLVNFEFLTRALNNYGFEPVDDDTAQRMGFPTAIGSFQDLFDIMSEEIATRKIRSINVGTALDMNSSEKQISFLNNYCIYKKIRNPNAKGLTLAFTSQTVEHDELDKDETGKLTKSPRSKPKRQVTKYKKKVTLPI